MININYIQKRNMFLFSLMILLILTIRFPGITDPTPTATPCCYEGFHQEPTYADPKGWTLGVMTDIKITGPTCVQWSNPETAEYHASGGNDTDVCVADENPSVYDYDVPENIIWTGPGYQDTGNPMRFVFTPSAPSAPNYCDSYTITVTADDTGDCNVGDEQKSDSINVSVWRCHPVTKYSTGTLPVYFLAEGVGLKLVSYTIVSTYNDCNGDFTGISQSVTCGLDYQDTWYFSATHQFVLGSTGGTVSNMGQCQEDCLMEEGDQCKCSYDTSSYSYDDITSSGLVSKFHLGPFIISTPGGYVTGIPTGFDRSVTLTTTRCCE